MNPNPEDSSSSSRKKIEIVTMSPSIIETFLIYLVLPLVLMTITTIIQTPIPKSLLSILTALSQRSSSPSTSPTPPTPVIPSLNVALQNAVIKRVQSQKSIKGFLSDPFRNMPTMERRIVEESKNKMEQQQSKSKNRANSIWKTTRGTSPKPNTKSSSRTSAKISQIPSANPFDIHIEKALQMHLENPRDMIIAFQYANALYQRDLNIHDGGSVQEKSIQAFKSAINLILQERQDLLKKGIPTNVPYFTNEYEVLEELNFNSQISIDGILADAYCAQGRQYYLANMYEMANHSFHKALTLDANHLESLNQRASTLIILGKYEQAASDYNLLLDLDTPGLYPDAFTGMARILVADEKVVPEGWEPLIFKIQNMIPQKEEQLASIQLNNNYNKALRELLVTALKKMHLTLFQYHDHKTLSIDDAWKHLSTAYEYKMSLLPPYNFQMEQHQTNALKRVFQEGFWPRGIGISSPELIFVIGFFRSGSTLLERVLDAHPLIAGTGEDSIFNGRLDSMRNSIVAASQENLQKLHDVVEENANGVIKLMRERWKKIERQSESLDDSSGNFDSLAFNNPERFVDKMLTNYKNVGFIHMLFPNALIFHVSREPMDTLFSAYKHDFPPGSIDYTSEIKSLAHMYCGYRDIMDHWDRVLPGRVIHIRYEDMVHDLPGIAKAIISTTGLLWDPGVLDFHKKKHAVNTHSTTQVRKGVFKSGIQSWRRYQNHLQPLRELVGERAHHQFHTTLKGYDKSLTNVTRSEV